jgi:hypothetical protein
LKPSQRLALLSGLCQPAHAVERGIGVDYFQVLALMTMASELVRRHGFTAGKPLPPGIRKNLARGKLLPPGIARTRNLSDPLLRDLPYEVL